MRLQRVPKALKRQGQTPSSRQTADEQELITPSRTHADSFVSLQRAVGNRGIQQLIEAGRIQPPSRDGSPVTITGSQHRHVPGHPTSDSPKATIAQRQTDGVIQRGWFDDAVDFVSDTASSAYDTASDAASGAWDTASDAASGAWDTVSEGASDAWDTVSEGASDAWDTVSEGASDAWDTVSEGASSAWDTVSEGASGAWEGAKSFAGEVWDGISGGASAAWDTLTDGAKAAWEGVVSAAQAVGGLASDAWEGLKSLGEATWRALSAAGRAVWEGIKWFGREAWEIIKAVGIVVWEKLCFYGDTLWNFISNIPTRIWRLVVDAWDGITGLLSWLGEGAAGFLSWLGDGLSRGFQWALDFAADPSLDKLGDAVKGILSWMGDGAMGALGWLWDGLKRGAAWVGTIVLRILELAGLGEFLSAIWGTIFHLRPLTDGEKGASQSIHGGLIPYDMVWVDEGSVITEVNGHRAVTTMHILHSPSAGEMSGPLAVHELTHVAQYTSVGALYMAQAVHAQIAGSKYDYGDLTGKHFSDLDREAQAQLCEDYYIVGGDGASPDLTHTTNHGTGTTNTVAQMRLLIAEMRAGSY